MIRSREVLLIKAAVRKRDDYRCKDCGISNNEYMEKTGRLLEVHRIVPGSLYTVEGCETLCQQCHGSRSLSASASTNWPASARPRRRRGPGARPCGQRRYGQERTGTDMVSVP